jgi:hypothetical protein
MAKPMQRCTVSCLLWLLISWGPGLMGCMAGDAVKGGSSATPVTAPGGQAQAANVLAPAAPVPLTPGAACGYQNRGTMLHIAEQIDLCLPPTTCTSETCPPPLGDCVDGACRYKPGYSGLATTPEAWVTYYCELSSGGCNGIGQSEPPATTAAKVASQMGLPLCEGNAAGGACVGIAATSAMLIGNSQVATDPVTGAYIRPWGLGVTEASGLCYDLTGPGGRVVVALTDRCGGYCKCKGSGYQECGPCVSAPDMAPNCPCVGKAPPLFDTCCGASCGKLAPDCDWCANNNHPHFDLDTATYNVVCGAAAVQGSCKLSAVAPVACPMGVAWPPP